MLRTWRDRGKSTFGTVLICDPFSGLFRVLLSAGVGFLAGPGSCYVTRRVCDSPGHSGTRRVTPPAASLRPSGDAAGLLVWRAAYPRSWARCFTHGVDGGANWGFVNGGDAARDTSSPAASPEGLSDAAGGVTRRVPEWPGESHTRRVT
jgi:hypothetical protein